MIDLTARTNDLALENRDSAEAMLVILGAGASYDCLPSTILDNTNVFSPFHFGLTVKDIRPPFTQELAEEGQLTNWFTNRWELARPVVSRLRDTLNSKTITSGSEKVQTLESALREYEAGALQDPARRSSLLAFSFYLRDLFNACTDRVDQVGGGVTNHVRLIDRVREWGTRKPNRTVTFVSFNYDLILENAMSSHIFSFNPLELQDYLKDPHTRLLKPHGSACWYWWDGSPPTNHLEQLLSPPPVLPRSVSLENSARNAIRLALEHGIETSQIFPQQFGYMGSGDTISANLIPALALPMDGKNEFVWPSEQSEAFNQLEGRVTHLMTIGWRALESHFVPLLGPLASPSSKVLVVAKDDDQETSNISQRLMAAITSTEMSQWRTYGQGFTGLLESSEELKWFLV